MTVAFSDDDYDLLAEDFTVYAPCALMIRTKAGALLPLELNASQRALHERLEEQRAQIGMVRALVLKGRQQGISTYVGGRFYHKVTNRMGFRAFVMTHLDDATQNLFEMTGRFHDECPEDLRPKATTASAKELSFGALNGGYKIATAGGRAPGRSQTIQLFHGSEFGFWPNAEENLAGVLEAMPNEPDTEAILESTANKPGDAFHKLWLAAKRGESQFIAIFLPWFIHEEYAITPPEGWTPPKAFVLYEQAHGLTRAQTYWAYLKNRDYATLRGLSTDQLCQAFKREYPATDEEAFETAADELNKVFPSEWVKAAMRRWEANKDRPKKPMTGLGLDVAEKGEDETACCPSHENRFERIAIIDKSLTTNGADLAGAVAAKKRDDATICVDLGGGWGGDVLTHLSVHLKQDAVGINPSTKSEARSKHGALPFKNTRARNHWWLREALDPESGQELELPPDPELEKEMAAMTFEVTPQGIQIIGKEELRKPANLGRSPDRLDAVILSHVATRLNMRKRADAAQKDGGDSGGYHTPGGWQIN